MNKPPVESCVETPATPEWLSKLESRREKLTSRGKLGHESGAGAPCNECGVKCPGLDLHFWRKVCRNCKCRKDQHMCPDDDHSGWAQFEILGQIRSKPAFMKIKALADEEVKLEWIPPNTSPDVVSDYMDKLGTNQIPIAGSDAAAKRKQQLQFQVPPHDLDAGLCDNLTDSETVQLEQYVKKIRENCVGQGNVFRVGDINHAKVNNIINMANDHNEYNVKKENILSILQEYPSPQLITDKIAMNLLNSTKLSEAILSDHCYELNTPLIAFSQSQISDIQNFGFLLTPESYEKLKNIPINMATVVSLTQNGPFYDKILSNLARKNLDVSMDPILQPIKNFRDEYLLNDNFKNDIQQLISTENPLVTQFTTPVKKKSFAESTFHSPIPLRNLIQTKFGAIMKQDTPMRKVKFGGVTIAHDLGLPIDAKIEKDKILRNLLNSEALRNALCNPSRPENQNLIIDLRPISPSSNDDYNENGIVSNVQLSAPTNMKIQRLGLNTNCIQSGFVNGPYYDQIFNELDNRGISYPNCSLLAPMHQFRQQLHADLPFQYEISKYVESLPNSREIAISGEPINQLEHYAHDPNLQFPFKSSKSSDSGFESKPQTPNYSTYPTGGIPGTGAGSLQMTEKCNEFKMGTPGKFASIPGIEELNMYPSVNLPSDHSRELMEINKNLIDLKLAEEAHLPMTIQDQVPILKCKDCMNNIMCGEVAVKAERVGKEIVWHPECFKCHSCRELLADLVYFFHGGNVYCGRDLAIIFNIPRCNACDELIFTKEYTAAEDATFHIKHFCCYQCDLPLADQQYISDEKTSMPLCLKCYDEFYAEKCQYCHLVIGPAEQGVAWGKIHWHGQCFMCAGLNCGKSLIGGRFCVKENLPFCSPKCVKSII